jgi:hypothetical protein
VRMRLSTQQFSLRLWSIMATMHTQQPLDAFYLYLCLGHVIIAGYCSYFCSSYCDLGGFGWANEVIDTTIFASIVVKNGHDAPQQPLDTSYTYLCLEHVILAVYCWFCFASCCDLGGFGYANEVVDTTIFDWIVVWNGHDTLPTAPGCFPYTFVFETCDSFGLLLFSSCCWVFFGVCMTGPMEHFLL